MTTLLQQILRARGEFRAKYGVDATHVFVDEPDQLPREIYGLSVEEIPVTCGANFAVGIFETFEK